MKNLVLKLTSVVGVFLLLIAILGASALWENNSSGYMQVLQGATSGKLTVRLQPGMYWQGLGAVTTYKVSDVYDFNSDGTRVGVRFNDAATASVSGQVKFRLPTSESTLLALHGDFRSYEAVHSDLVRQVVSAALKQTATYFRAEEVYSTRRADFIDLVNDQIKQGIYATTYTEQWKKDENGDAQLVRLVQAKRDAQGDPIVSERSGFATYGIELVQLVINDIDFDEKTDSLIAKRKESEQEQVVAKANAERAKQDAITAEAQGRRDVAIAEAKALVEKKTAVVAAERETAVMAQRALQAEEQKKAIIAKGEADAMATKLKVAAGLSPLERATIEKETAIGVASQLAKVKLPGLMVLGGKDGGGGALNPFDAVGLQSFIRMSKELSESTNGKSTP